MFAGILFKYGSQKSTQGTKVLWVLIFIVASYRLSGQNTDKNFLNTQMKWPRVAAAFKKYDDTLSKQFGQKGIEYPCSDLLIRVFKSQNELELWARNKDATEYTLVRQLRVCALSGNLGPKLRKGDLQVPEGYYFIDSFNPNSNYHLSLSLSYPNYADQHSSKLQHAEKQKGDLGGDIFIHGGCVTVGCVPLGDEGIKQLYIACLRARVAGQRNIPVQIYPTRFTDASLRYLRKTYGGDDALLRFWNTLKEGYDYFEMHHRPLPVMYTPDGQYVY
jgi:murein L,D-transpeptidase YafK